ncbi:TlpA family protein disulfide reductase [Winogradskyella sp.]|uniref:TlpA family protein disulfide reductase n=1 Tax=Winogradskyella sp. TaxID=1883156 RepID=UPI003BAB0733
MKKMIIYVMLFGLYGCQKTNLPNNAEELIALSIDNTSTGDQWNHMHSASILLNRTTKISGNTVENSNYKQFFKYPGKQRNEIYTNGKLTSSIYYTPKKNLIISYNNDKKGFTDIPHKPIYKSPLFEIKATLNYLVLSDTLIGLENFYKLTDTVNGHKYLFDWMDYFLVLRETKTNYGWQKEKFENYQNIDGYMIPKKISRSIPESQYVQEDIIVDIKINNDIDDDVFVIDESDRKIVLEKEMPNFSFQDFDNPDLKITNKSLRGKTVLLDFWATWCGPCIKEIPNIENLYKQYKDKGFEVVSVSLDKNKGLVESFRENQSELPWKNAILTKGFKDPQSITMEVSSLPKVILFDPNGKIIAIDEQAKGDKLAAKLSSIFNDSSD